MRRLVVPLLCVLATAVVLLAPAAALAKPTYDQAVAQLFAKGYPQRIENRLIATGAARTYLGLRSAGDPADNAAARLLAAELRRIGLRNVRLEAVPIDAWVFHSASVAFGGKTVRCSAFNAGRGTPKAGLTAPVVYVHGGTAADFAAAGDVHGKLVLLDQMSARGGRCGRGPKHRRTARSASSTPSIPTIPSTGACPMPVACSPMR